MNSADRLEEIEIESRIVRWTRLAFMGGLLFWPFFLFALTFMMASPAGTGAALIERRILVVCVWLYPIAVGTAWMLSKRAVRNGGSDFVCLLPWLPPALMFAYWLIYFTL